MKQLIKNLFHTATAKVLIVLVQFGVSTILARKLSAEDYGVVGFANVILAFLVSINGMGVGPALIRTKDPEPEVLGTAATLNLLLSISAFILAQLAAPLCGWMLNSPASVSVVRVLAIGFLISPIGFLSSCVLNKEMKFKALRTPQVIGAVIRGGAMIEMASAGMKHWSLVAGNLLGSLINNVLLKFSRPVQFRWLLNKEHARRLLAVGVPLALSDVLIFAVLNTDNFFLGSALGSKTLGYYTVAFTWATFLCTTVYQVVHTVLFPKFSLMQDDLPKLRDAYLRSLRLVLFIAAIGNGALFVCSKPFLVTILGHGTERWLPSLVALQILCAYGIIRAATETIANPILALGNTGLFLKANLLAFLLEVPLMYWVAVHFGIEGVAILSTLSYTAQNIIYIRFLDRELGVGASKLFSIGGPVAGATVVSSAAIMAASFLPSTGYAGIVCRGLAFSGLFIVVHELLSGGRVIAELGAIRASWKGQNTDSTE